MNSGMHLPARRSIANRYAVIAAAGGALLSIGVPALLSSSTGSWGIPHNDDWAFTKIAEEFADSGHVRLPGWNNTGVLGQALLLGPLGGDAWARHLLVVVCAAAALASVFQLLASRSGAFAAAVGTLTLAAASSFGLLASSFMTDLPTLSAIAVCLALGEAAVRRESPVMLGTAVLIGVWGTSIREQALFAPMAVLLVAVLAHKSVRMTRAAIALGAASLCLVLVYEVWRRALPNAMNPVSTPTPAAGLVSIVRIHFTVALMLFPALLFAANPKEWRPLARLSGLAVVALGVALTAMGKPVALGNYLDRHGAYAAASLGARTVLPSPLFWMVMIIGVLSGGLLAGHLISRWRSVDRPAKLYVAGALIVASAPVFLGQPPMDRYLLPSVLTGLLVVLESVNAGSVPARLEWFGGRPRRVTLVGAALSVSWVLSLLLTANALAYDGARWRAAEALVSRGVPATDVDAGLEWDGMHARTPVSLGEQGRTTVLHWATRMFPESRECYVVAGAPLAGLVEVARSSYGTYAVFGISQVRTYQVDPCR